MCSQRRSPSCWSPGIEVNHKTEAFSYPLTSVPLAIATPEFKLRQSEKVSFRNFLITESGAILHECPRNVAWLVDGMAAIKHLNKGKPIVFG